MDFRRVLLLLLFCFEPPLLANCLPILPAENAAPSASESVYLPDEEPVRLSQEERALRLLDTYGEGEGRVFFLHTCGALQGLETCRVSLAGSAAMNLILVVQVRLLNQQQVVSNQVVDLLWIVCV